MLVVNGDEPLTRQRYSIAHEAHHIVMHPFIGYAYPAFEGQSSYQRGEQVADYFAACLLMPRVWVKRAWVSGTQGVHELAGQFEVSPAAMQYRLVQLGLHERARRCAPAA